MKCLSAVKNTDWAVSKPNDRLAGKETAEDNQGDENQTTENLEFCSDVVLLIAVLLSGCVCEVPPLFVHVKTHAASRLAFFISY